MASFVGDPSLDEMVAFLAKEYCEDASDCFDIYEAIYWFAADWHGGQWSNLYSALCNCGFRPGPIATACEPDGLAEDMYQALEAEYVEAAAG